MRGNKEHKEQAAAGRTALKMDETCSGLYSQWVCELHTHLHEKEVTDVELMNGLFPKGRLVVRIILICGLELLQV